MTTTLLHASASQTHGTRCTRHTWTTANLNNIPSINVRHCGTQTGWPTKVGRVPVPLTLKVGRVPVPLTLPLTLRVKSSALVALGTVANGKSLKQN